MYKKNILNITLYFEEILRIEISHASTAEKSMLSDPFRNIED